MTSSSDINDTFKILYEDLYTSENKVSNEELESFLNEMIIPKNFQEGEDKLEAPITEAAVNKSYY